MKPETYNAIAFLDLEEDHETLTPLGNEIAEAFESGDTAHLGVLYSRALKAQIQKERERNDKFWRDAFAMACPIPNFPKVTA